MDSAGEPPGPLGEPRPAQPSDVVTDLPAGAPVDKADRQLGFLESLQRLSSDVSVIVDADLHIVYVAPAVEELLGYSPEDVIARVGLDFVHLDDRPLMQAGIREVADAPTRVVTVRLRAKDAAGAWRWLDNTITNRLGDRSIGGFVVNVRDVSVEVEARAAARELEARLQAIVEGAQEGIAAIGFDGKAMFVNSRAAELLGRPLEELREANIPALFGFDDAESMRLMIGDRLERGPERYDLPYPHPDGSERILSISASPYVTADGRFLGTLGMVTDVTGERRAEAVLRRQAYEDPLTGLGNRRVLTERLSRAARGEDDDERLLAVVLLDIDDLKAVNEFHGHEAGDQLLVDVGRVLKDFAGTDDTAVRLGGDEFALVLERAGIAELEQVVARVRAALRGLPVAVEGRLTTASVGAAVSPPQPPEELLRCASIALDEAKRTAFGGAVYFDDDLSRRHRRRRAIAALVRNDVPVDQVRLHYQPLVDLGTGRLKGLEALLRWHHPTLGALAPDEIVGAFEATGSSARLDELVLARASADMAMLRQQGAVPDDAYLAVNVSAVTLERPQGFQAALERVLSDGCLPPDRLVLEVTEGAVMREPERATRILHRLTDEGLRLAVDDFGTGYSSLRYLQTLPLSILKVDRSFVRPLADDLRARTLAESIVGLARTVGLDTVAEGVETADQLQVLVDLGCRTGQGFLWSPAVPRDEVAGVTERILQERA